MMVAMFGLQNSMILLMAMPQQVGIAGSSKTFVHHVHHKGTIIRVPNSISAIFDIAAALLSLTQAEGNGRVKECRHKAENFDNVNTYEALQYMFYVCIVHSWYMHSPYIKKEKQIL